MTQTDVKVKQFTADDVLASLRGAINTYGEDWVDPNARIGPSSDAFSSCVNEYEHEGETRHCIAAWVLQDLLEEKPDYSEVPGWYNIKATIISFADDRFTPDAVELLSFAQRLQDKKTPWGAIYVGVRMIHDLYLP